MITKKEFFFRVFLTLGAIIFSLVILEFTLRIISPGSIFHPLLPLYPKNKIELHVNLKGCSPLAIYSTNTWGLRGDEPPPPSQWKEYCTIVTIGGSATQCFYLDDHKTWAYLLQERLKNKYPKAWIGNGGLLGQTTKAHIIFMKEIIPKIKPDAVILLAGANDLSFSINGNPKDCGSPYDYYKPGWKRKLFFKSRLTQILYTWKLIVFDKVAVEKKNGPPRFVPKLLGENPMPLPEDLKTLLPCFNQYQANIREIIKLSRSMNVRIIFLTQPLLFDDTPYWRSIEGAFYWIKETRVKLSAATFWKLLDIYNKELMKICKTENIECLDLASLIPHSNLYFYDACHFNERGAQLVAEKIAEFFKIEKREQ